MAKRGGTVHLKRIAAPKAIPVTDKKAATWMTRASAGPHPMARSIPLGILLRDVIKAGKTMREVKKILYLRSVHVDGVPRLSEKFPVGLMDVVTLVPEERSYRIEVDWKGRLQPAEIKPAQAGTKIAKVTGKHVAPGGKIGLTFHDSRNIFGDNHIHVGDSVVLQLPKGRKEKAKILSHLKLEKGARCLISEGKHAGRIVQLKDIVKRVGRKSEAVVEAEKGEEFITVLDYLVVVDKDFEVGKHG